MAPPGFNPLLTHVSSVGSHKQVDRLSINEPNRSSASRQPRGKRRRGCSSGSTKKTLRKLAGPACRLTRRYAVNSTRRSRDGTQGTAQARARKTPSGRKGAKRAGPKTRQRAHKSSVIGLSPPERSWIASFIMPGLSPLPDAAIESRMRHWPGQTAKAKNHQPDPPTPSNHNP